MIRFIPSLIENKIEREQAYMDIFSQEEKKNPYKDSIEKVKERKDETLRNLRRSVTIFKTECPEEWDKFEKNITYMFSYSKMLDERSPFDYVAIAKKEGILIDSNYWTLIKAHASGQREILDSIMYTFSIDPTKIKMVNKKSFFKRLLTAFRILISST